MLEQFYTNIIVRFHRLERTESNIMHCCTVKSKTKIIPSMGITHGIVWLKSFVWVVSPSKNKIFWAFDLSIPTANKPTWSILRHDDTVRSRYIAVIFPRITHERHPYFANEARCELSIVSAKSDWSWTILIVSLYTLSSYNITVIYRESIASLHPMCSLEVPGYVDMIRNRSSLLNK